MVVQEQLIDQATMDEALGALGEHKGVVIDAFLQQAGGFVADVVKYSAAQNTDQIIMASHSLKGASLQLGFYQLGMAAKAVEDLARQSGDEFPEFEGLNQQLKLSYDATISYIQDELLSD